MVISNIIGGLGNQMFQYAAACALILERAQALRLDISGFAGYALNILLVLEWLTKPEVVLLRMKCRLLTNEAAPFYFVVLSAYNRVWPL